MKTFYATWKTIALTVGLLAPFAAKADVDLRDYYLIVPVPWEEPLPAGTPDDYPPAVRVVGGAANPPLLVTLQGRQYEHVIRHFFRPNNTFGDWESPVVGFTPLNTWEALRYDICTRNIYQIPKTASVNDSFETDVGYLGRGSFGAEPDGSIDPFGYEVQQCGEIGLEPPRWWFKDKLTVKAPVRRKAVDGSEYEASPLVVEREGLPWITYYFAYRMGLVGRESNWLPENESRLPNREVSTPGGVLVWGQFPSASDDFNLVRLPAPYVDGVVTEYVNHADFPESPGGHFFYTSNEADRQLLDSITNWQRTGQSFNSGGYVSVCRLYGRQPLGPNSHFYSADRSECDMLAGNGAWTDEGVVFYASRVLDNAAAGSVAAACPNGSVPLYRLYNNGWGKGYDGNHRYLTNRDQALAFAAAQGWVFEEAAMCVPE